MGSASKRAKEIEGLDGVSIHTNGVRRTNS